MRAVADHKKRAEECRQLAKLTAKPEDWQHFLEMAETWEMFPSIVRLILNGKNEEPPTARP